MLYLSVNPSLRAAEAPESAQGSFTRTCIKQRERMGERKRERERERERVEERRMRETKWEEGGRQNIRTGSLTKASIYYFLALRVGGSSVYF